MRKFHTDFINKLSEKITDLEILNQRAIHLNTKEQYTIEYGLVITKELQDLREDINSMLKNIDNELFSYEDDGR